MKTRVPGPAALVTTGNGRFYSNGFALEQIIEDGTIGERIVAYHEEQARGGVGLIVSGACGVMYPVGKVQPWQIAISEDRYIPGLKKVVDAVHRHGAKIAVQLHMGGLVAGDDTREGLTAIVSVKLPDPQFESQTKVKLLNNEIRNQVESVVSEACLLYTSPSPRNRTRSRMPSSA